MLLSATLRIRVSTVGVAVGTYRGYVILAADGATNTVRVDASLRVTLGGPIIVVPQLDIAWRYELFGGPSTSLGDASPATLRT